MLKEITVKPWMVGKSMVMTVPVWLRKAHKIPLKQPIKVFVEVPE